MCGYTCARSLFFLLTFLMIVLGSGLLGVGIYGQVHKLVHGEHFLDRFFASASGPPMEEELKSRLMLYFMVVTGVGIGLGTIIFLSGIVAVNGACRNFKVVTRYGNTVS